MTSMSSLIPEAAPLVMAWGLLRARLAASRADEGGYSTETVIITAVLAALAIAVTGIIVAKVIGKANDIPTE